MSKKKKASGPKKPAKEFIFQRRNYLLMFLGLAFIILGYILMAVGIIIYHIAELPAILVLIVSDAFTPMAGVGAAIGWGVKRGVYSNEAGQGSGPHAASASEVEHPAQQGLVQSFSVYVDTLFVCSATAFMIPSP